MNNDIDMLELVPLSEIKKLQQFSPLLLNGELESLLSAFEHAKLYHTVLNFSREQFNYWDDILNKRKNRRGEVVFAIRAGDSYLVHTKAYYPKSTYRLLSGGVRPNETVLNGLHREVFEETGMKILRADLLSILFYDIVWDNCSLSFVSYLFDISTDRKQPSVQDISEKIAEFKWIPRSRLPALVRQLKNLPDQWQDWGDMRLLPHEILMDIVS